MRDQDLNERPGEAPPQSKLENPGETKTKRKRSPSTHRVEPRKVVFILQIAQWTILGIQQFSQFLQNPQIAKIVHCAIWRIKSTFRGSTLWMLGLRFRFVFVSPGFSSLDCGGASPGLSLRSWSFIEFLTLLKIEF